MTTRTALEHDGALGPVTALAFFADPNLPRTLLLAGEGSFLKIYDCNTAQAVSHVRIFSSQAIHGIEIHIDGCTNLAHILIWGGYSVRTLRIRDTVNISPGNSNKKSPYIQLDEELSALDWILDASFFPSPELKGYARDPAHVSAALLTAHNSLHLLTVDCHTEVANEQHQTLKTIGSSLRSILYSAHVICTSQTDVLVAAGTVFGEILVWSGQFVTQPQSHAGQTKSTIKLLYTLSGHAGSIFGVHISPLLNFSGVGHQRLLASCSDDRTIRVWDISDTTTQRPDAIESPAFNHVETGFGTNSGAVQEEPVGSENLVAIGWGHSSRVWGIRFLPSTPAPSSQDPSKIDLLSFGEDATCRRWSLQENGIASTPNLASVKGSLVSTRTFSLHNGKNIWSVDVAVKGTDLLFSTGGADGKISLICQPYCKDLIGGMDPYDREWVIEEIEASVNPHASREDIFLEGGPRGDSAPISLGHGVQDHLPSLLNKEAPTEEFNTTPKQKTYTFKSYAFIGPEECLFTTSQGKVFLGTLSNLVKSNYQATEPAASAHGFTWTSLMELGSLKSYSVISSDSASKTAFFSGTDGIVYLYNHMTRKARHLFQVPTKVSSLFVEFCAGCLYVLVNCVGSKDAYYCTLQSSKTGGDWIAISPIENPSNIAAVLELPETFITTSMGIAPNQELLLLGSRSGALAAYDILGRHGSVKRPVLACFRHIQGEDAVTVILSLPPSHSPTLDLHILTAGRNGAYSIHKLCRYHTSEHKTLSVRLDTVHTSTPPFGPLIEGAHFHPTTNDLILWGFHSTAFIVWNESCAYEVFRVECGGAHRAWAFSPSLADGGGSFVWTKVSKLHLHAQFQDSHRTIQARGHGREIKASAISIPLPLSLTDDAQTTRQLIATGAEDTTIRICEYIPSSGGTSDSKGHFKHLGAFKKHTTGIQHLAWSGCGEYLFSGAGVEEFYVWRVRQIPGFGVGVICEGACPVASSLPDLRITGFAVDEFDSGGAGDAAEHKLQHFIITMGFSNSTVKTYRYSTQAKQFALLFKGQYTTCCLTQIFHHWIDKELCLLTAATDGRIALWTTPASDLTSNDTKDNKATEVFPMASWHRRSPIHQSSIKSMLTIPISPSTILVVTGGDDNALIFTRLRFPPDRNSVSPDIVQVPRAHASAITAIEKINLPREDGSFQFVTSGNDQRIKIWDVRVLEDRAGADGIEVDCAASIGTSVADVSSIVIQGTTIDNAFIVVAGVGVDVFKVRNVLEGEM